MKWSTMKSLMARSAVRAAILLGVLAVAFPVAASDKVPLNVKVIHATKGEASVDEELKPLVKDFKTLPFQVYALKDEANFELEVGAKGRMQLPSKAWMTVVPVELRGDALRLEIAIKEVKFRTIVAVQPGATLAVGGPRYGDGVLILAVTRDKKPG